MRGHVREYRSKDGKRRTYRIVFDVGRDENGKRQQKWLTKDEHGRPFVRKKDAEAELRRVLGDVDDGTYTEPSRQTLNEHAAEWLKSQPKLLPSTLLWYRDTLNTWALPYIGNRELRLIRVGDLNELYRMLELKGGKKGKPLSRSTVGAVHTAIRKCLQDAVRKGKLARNPADLADPPSRKSTRQMHTWTSEQVSSFLAQSREDRLYPLWLTAITTGMRRGEVLGLRWEDTDLEEGRVRVRRTVIATNDGVHFSTPKTSASRRSVPLPAETVAGLRTWKAQQARERLAWGEAYNDFGLVFSRENGEPFHPDVVSKTFEKRGEKIKLPRIRFHDLRHTFATLALEAGVPAKVVSVILGHSSVAITLDVYSHSVPALEEAATAKVASLIFGTR